MVPLNDSSGGVSLAVPPNAVVSGIVVSASALADVAATGQPLPTYLRSAPAGASTTSLVSAYQITFSPDASAIAVGLPAALTLSYTDAQIPLNGLTTQSYDPVSTFRIYFFDGAAWIALPQNVVTTGAKTVTATIGTLIKTAPAGVSPIQSNLKSGIYTIFATGAPAPAPRRQRALRRDCRHHV